MDVEMLRIAAGFLVGRHDFTPFSDRHSKTEEAMVEVFETSLLEEEPLLHFRIAADHFRYLCLRAVLQAAHLCRRPVTVYPPRA